MFARTIIKIMLRENARLRREVRHKEQTINNLIKMFVFKEKPVNKELATSSEGFERMEDVNDSYSLAMEDAEKNALKIAGMDVFNDYEAK